MTSQELLIIAKNKPLRLRASAREKKLRLRRPGFIFPVWFFIYLLPLIFSCSAQCQSDPEKFDWAARLIERGQCKEALPVLEELIGRNPDRAAIFLALGQCHFELGQYIEAEAPLSRAVKLAPNLPQGHYLLGSVLGMLNKGNEAMAELRLATRLAPDFAPAFRVMGMFQVEHKQFAPEVRTALEMAIRLDPSDHRAQYWLGRYWQGIKDPVKALNCYEIALKREPASLQARVGLAQVLFESGEIERAKTEFERILNLDPGSVPALLGKARCLYSRQEYVAALDLLHNAEKKVENIVDQRQLYWLLSRLYRVTGQVEAAIRAEEQLKEFEREIEKGLAGFWETGK